MIGALRGRLISSQAPNAVVDCGGVGYEVETPMSTFLGLPAIGEDVFLHTHMVVRENAHALYGFASMDEKHLFRTLLGVSGVGAKMALAVLSGMSVADFERCVHLEDATTLVKIPGVGKKTAERLIIEMRDKIDRTPSLTVVAGPATTDSRSEAIDALISLGYKPSEVKRLLSSIGTDDMSAEDIIRVALRQAAN